MWFRSLVDALFARSSRISAWQRRHAPRDRQRSRSFRPLLEILEDRCLPSTFTVTNLLDSGPGSLRAAVSAANANPGADVINFATTGAITLTSGELDITDSLTINGPGLNSLTVSGNHASRVFGLTGNPTVSIAGLTVANGGTTDSPGGGIYEAGGALTLDRCALTGNVAYSAYGGQAAGGGFYLAGGTLTLVNCTLSANEAYGVDGFTVPSSQSFPAGSAAGGGLYIAGGSASIDNSTFSGNGARGGNGNPADACSGLLAGDGGQGEGGGLYVAGGSVSIDNSTFAANGARGGDGGSGGNCLDAPYPGGSYLPGGNGGLAGGGGIRVAAGTVEVQHSTLSGNGATGGLGGDTNASPGVAAGGGISNAGGLQMYDAILAGNTADVAPDLDGAFTSLGHNLIGNSSGGSGFAASDLLNVDPQLGPLQNNGGPTQTMALQAGSPAIDAGDDAGAPAYDQRGPGFARIVNGTIDIGAFEVQNGSSSQASSLAVAGFPSVVTAGVAGGFTVTAKNADGIIDVGYTGTVHFSSSDGQAGLPADYTFTAADGGAHTFSATLKTAGAQSITAADGTTFGLTGTDGGITVNAAAASAMTVAGFPSSATAGVASYVTVTLKDAYGNTASGYTGTVHFTSTDAKASLPANYTFTAADAGVHTFSATLKTAGVQSITVTDATTAGLTGTDGGVTVNAAAASTMTVAGFPSSITAGVAGSFTVTLQDAYGNTASGYTGTVYFTSSDGKAVLPANYTFTAADAGAHTFSAILKTAGVQSITGTDATTAGLTGTDRGVTVAAAAASQFIISAPSSVTSGAAFSLTVTVEDAYGNVVTGYTGTIHFSSTDGKATLPMNYTFTAADKGVHTFTGLVLRTTGYQTITVTDTLDSALNAGLIVDVLAGPTKHK